MDVGIAPLFSLSAFSQANVKTQYRKRSYVRSRRALVFGRAEPPAPGLARGTSFGRGEEVLQRNVHERGARFGQRRLAVEELAADADAAPAVRLDPRADE